MAKKKQILEATNDTPSSLETSLEVFEEFEKDFGDSGFKFNKPVIETIDSGSPAMNDIICIPGYPKGRITHLYGPEGAGKSFLAMLAVKNALDSDPNAIAVWFDSESSFTTDWGLKFGIWNPDPKKSRIKVIKGNKGKDIFERIVGKITKDQFGGAKKTKDGLLDYIKAGKLNCPIIVIDSIADIMSPREVVAPVGGLTVSALAGFLTSELKRISFLLEEVNTSLLCINQVRENLDEAAQRREGKFHFPGGKNLAHKMSLNIFVDKIYSKDAVIYANENDESSSIGRKVRITVKKNRFGVAPISCTTTLIFKEGGDYKNIGIGNVEEEIVNLAIKYGFIKQGGAWCALTYKSTEDKINGIDKVVDFYKSDPAELNKLYDLIKKSKPTYTETIQKENDDDDEIDDLLSNESEENIQ